MTTNLPSVRAQQVIDGPFADIIICKEDNPEVLLYTKSLNLLTHQVSVIDRCLVVSHSGINLSQIPIPYEAGYSILVKDAAFIPFAIHLKNGDMLGIEEAIVPEGLKKQFKYGAYRLSVYNREA